jgi:hypothetical protein
MNARFPAKWLTVENSMHRKCSEWHGEPSGGLLTIDVFTINFPLKKSCPES